MKWACKIGHNFYYYDESESPELSDRLVANKRFCKRCNLIQFRSMVSGNWYVLRPTRGDLRWINLIKLL